MESGKSIYNQDDATGFIKLQRPPPPRKGDGKKAGLDTWRKTALLFCP
ncbi:MAG: hypothetical protein NTY01_16990 [Verrucomicrobia bacterium]|nr:hypothetical protein [Verrucomicrobiota bacterium]